MSTENLLGAIDREPKNREAVERLTAEIEAAEGALKASQDACGIEVRRSYLAEKEFDATRKQFADAEILAVEASLLPDEGAFLRQVRAASNLREARDLRYAGLQRHRNGALKHARRAALQCELSLLNLQGQLHLFRGDILLAEVIRGMAESSRLNGGHFALNESVLVAPETRVGQCRQKWADTIERSQQVTSELKALEGHN
jgi:hypothetical protein